MLQRQVLQVSRTVTSRTVARPPFLSIPARSLTAQSSRLPAAWSVNARIARRWYSEAAEAKKPEDGASKAAETKTSDAKPEAVDVEKLKADLEARNKEVIDLKDKYLRAIADYRNLQERTKRETQAARDFALQKFAKDLVAPIDNFEHALSSVAAERLSSVPSSESPEETIQSLHKDLVSLHKGVQMIETVLVNTIEKHGLVRFDPALKGEKFDPNIHEAVFMAPMPAKEDGTVFHTQQKGFMLNGRVIRAPKVGVVKNS